jgi:translation initiation factor IF-3
MVPFKQKRPLLTCRRWPGMVGQATTTGMVLWAQLAPTTFLWRCFVIATQDLMINEEIRDPEVRLIDENGSQLGIVSIREAQALADQRNLDLVKIAPGSNPPVCKLMDYGKYRFEMAKREKEQRKNQKIIEVKEVRLSATIDLHDMEVKAKAARRFFSDGNKVKVSIRFRGRQITHGEIGLDVMNQFFEMVQENAVIERPARQEGRNMFMVLAPKNN